MPILPTPEWRLVPQPDMRPFIRRQVLVPRVAGGDVESVEQRRILQAHVVSERHRVAIALDNGIAVAVCELAQRPVFAAAGDQGLEVDTARLVDDPSPDD